MVVGLEVCGREVEVCVREVETYGGRVGGMWERWRCAGEVEVCERGGDVWW